MDLWISIALHNTVINTCSDCYVAVTVRGWSGGRVQTPDFRFPQDKNSERPFSSSDFHSLLKLGSVGGHCQGHSPQFIRLESLMQEADNVARVFSTLNCRRKCNFFSAILHDPSVCRGLHSLPTSLSVRGGTSVRTPLPLVACIACAAIPLFQTLPLLHYFRVEVGLWA